MNYLLLCCIILGLTKDILFWELDICYCQSEHKTSTGVEPQHGEGKKTKIYFQTKSSIRNVLCVCREMDGSPCNIKTPCLAMPTVPLLSTAPALPASRTSALLSRWHFKAGTQTWQAWLPAWSQPPRLCLSPFCHPLSSPRLKDAASTPAGLGQRQESHRFALWSPCQKLYPQP